MKNLFLILGVMLLFLVGTSFANTRREGVVSSHRLSSIKKVLDGKGASCDEKINLGSTHDYECNDVGDYRQIRQFITHLENRKFQNAATLLNQKNVLPRIISSINKPIFFVPYKNGILGFYAQGNGDVSYVMKFITIDKGNLMIYNSRGYFYIYSDTSKKTFVSRVSGINRKVDEYEIVFPASCFNSDPRSENYEKCIDAHFRGVLTNKTKDKNTQLRVNAMKRRIDKLK